MDGIEFTLPGDGALDILREAAREARISIETVGEREMVLRKFTFEATVKLKPDADNRTLVVIHDRLMMFMPNYNEWDYFVIVCKRLGAQAERRNDAGETGIEFTLPSACAADTSQPAASSAPDALTSPTNGTGNGQSTAALDVRQLHKKLDECFNEEDLRDLCFGLETAQK
jgi:hypothetical protein